MACGREGGTRAIEALTKLGPDWPHLPQTRRTLLHVGHIFRFYRDSVLPTNPHLTLFTIGFKSALIAYLYSFLLSQQPLRPKSPFACPRPIQLTDPIDWLTLAQAGLDGRPSPTFNSQMSDAERFIHFGR